MTIKNNGFPIQLKALDAPFFITTKSLLFSGDVSFKLNQLNKKY